MADLLLIDQDEQITSRVAHFFEGNGHRVWRCTDYLQAVELIETRVFDVIVTSTKVESGTAADILLVTKQSNISTVLIVAAEPGDVELAVQVIREGAFDFIQKPYNIAELYVKVEKAIEIRRLQNEAQNLRGERGLIYKTNDFIGVSPRIRQVLMLVNKVAKTESGILITGETGTGKELIAGAIHYNSLRPEGPFIRVNCAALPDQLLENELFGHERGAYTGADRQQVGRFEQADGGTILLDEIGDMSTLTQAKVLRVLQEKEFERLGSSRTIRVDIRIVTATNKNLPELVKEGKFREDLYYRLNVVNIHMPPLRERREDIMPLVTYFLGKFSAELKKNVWTVHPTAIQMLMNYHWPGNVRELENTIERAVIMTETDTITPSDLNIPFKQEGPANADSFIRLPPQGIDLEDVEKSLIMQALERGKWIQKEAADLLGLSRRVLNYKIQKHGITHTSWKRNK